jgi:N-acetylmuramoyl-L-alanine amidase
MLKPTALLLVAVVIFSFTFFTVKNPLNKVTTIVIDAGHGGKDKGCNGELYKEKDVTLSVALKLGKLIEEKLKDVKVIYTRKTDVFVELEERAQIANRNKADLFISIHCNAASSMKTVMVKGVKKKREVINPRPYGSETYVMGIKNEAGKAKVALRENSVMLLEDNYKKTYNGFDPESEESYIMMINYTSKYVEMSAQFAANIQKEYKAKAGRIDKGVKRESLWVLWRTQMPSVLTELGFLTNVEEEKFIGSEKGKDYMAAGIFRAFRNYKNDVEGTNLKFDDEIEKMEPVTNENITKGDTAYMHEIEDYNDDSDTLDQSPEEKLKNLFKEANAFFSVGDYDKAEKKYAEVLTVKDDNKTAKDKIEEIKKIRAKYKTNIDKADRLFKDKKYTDAKKIYDEAQVLMPKENYPTEKIREIDKLSKPENLPSANEKEYNKILADADALYGQKNYKDALEKYEQCKTLKPGDKSVEGLIALCKKYLADNPATESKFSALLKKGDDLFARKDFENARLAYKEALMVKEGDQAVLQKIEDCDDNIEQAQTTKKYAEIIAAADKLFNAADYVNARKKYQDAIFLKPSEQYPKDQVSKIEAINKPVTDDGFEKAMKEAENFLLNKNFLKAKEAFSIANTIRPGSPEPKLKIAETDKLMAAQKKAEDEEAQYQLALKYGDNYISAKDFVKAKESYEKALSIKPTDALATQKIADCNKYINAGAENIYSTKIAEGDECFKRKDFNCALDKYKEAATLKPAEDYPKFQIRLSEKSIKWQNDNTAFLKLVRDGEDFFKNDEFDKSVSAYESAVSFINGVTENKSKFKPTIEELGKKIADVKAAKENKNKPVNPKDLIRKFDQKAYDDSVAASKNIAKGGDVIEFRVQFATSDKELDIKSAKYKMLEKISFYKMGAAFKYTTGKVYSLADVIVLQQKVRDLGFKDAFAIALKNGQRIELKVAEDLLQQKKNP